MEIPDLSAELGHQDASMYRTCVGILLYLLVDLPQCQYVIRYLPSFSSKPTEKSLTVLKDLVGYMAAHSDQCHVFEMERFAEKRLLVRSVMGALILEILMAARLESLCYFLGTWRGNNLEGANDPGNIFRHVTNQRQQGYSQAQINLLISALSVLTQLQGCSGPMDAVALQMDFSVVLLLT
jgi:hypothetical protein